MEGTGNGIPVPLQREGAGGTCPETLVFYIKNALV